MERLLQEGINWREVAQTELRNCSLLYKDDQTSVGLNAWFACDNVFVENKLSEICKKSETNFVDEKFQ